MFLNQNLLITGSKDRINSCIRFKKRGEGRKALNTRHVNFKISMLSTKLESPRLGPEQHLNLYMLGIDAHLSEIMRTTHLTRTITSNTNSSLTVTIFGLKSFSQHICGLFICLHVVWCFLLNIVRYRHIFSLIPTKDATETFVSSDRCKYLR